MAEYKAIGIMSGTSLDGVDIASCHFLKLDGKWKYTIDKAETIEYTSAWKKRLSVLKDLTARELALLHTEYGRLLGNLVKNFIEKHKLTPDFVASHGHTIFHQPERQFTFQIGSGAEIAAISGKTVICDFRTTDVALGGQGAPLVPVGDELLFDEYDFCLNLGGFANISFKPENKRLAFDICPLNIVLNHLSGLLGLEYDKNGLVAASGKVDATLLDKLNHLEYYSKTAPKSLGVEWLEKYFLTLLADSVRSIPDQLRTVVEHCAVQISNSIQSPQHAQVLVTGGGTFNNFLMERISSLAGNHQINIPDEKIINFKEALIFAFLGLLRILEQPNCLKSVTGASVDNIGGAVYFGS